MMGKRALDDQRNQLVFHYVRLVAELRPKFCVFENVKGLTLGKHAQFLDELILALGDAGYNVLLPYRVLNASDFGVPQDRQRLFLIGARADQVMPSYPDSVKHKTTVWEALTQCLQGVAAVLIVYSSRGAAMPWANTHHEHALRTLIIGYSLWVVAGLLVLINGALYPITVYLQLGIAIWAGLRALVALVLGVMRKPVPNPRGWFV